MFFGGTVAFDLNKLTLAAGSRALVLLFGFLVFLLEAVKALRHALAESVVLVDLLELIAEALFRFLWRELDLELLYSFPNFRLVACVIT